MRPRINRTHPHGEKMSNRKSFDVSFKLKAVEFASKRSKQAAAREFGMDPKCIRVWCSQKEELLALKKKEGRRT